MEIPKILFHTERMEKIFNGEKLATVRQGRREYPLGEVICQETNNEDNFVKLNIKTISYKRFKDLDDDDAYIDGYADVEDLRQVLWSIYPNLTANSEVTIVEFYPFKL